MPTLLLLGDWKKQQFKCHCWLTLRRCLPEVKVARPTCGVAMSGWTGSGGPGRARPGSLAWGRAAGLELEPIPLKWPELWPSEVLLPNFNWFNSSWTCSARTSPSRRNVSYTPSSFSSSLPSLSLSSSSSPPSSWPTLRPSRHLTWVATNKKNWARLNEIIS